MAAAVAIKEELQSAGEIADTFYFAQAKGLSHADIVGACKSLASSEFLTTADLSRQSLDLTADGKVALAKGSPEAVLFGLVPPDAGVLEEALAAQGGDVRVGLAKAIEKKWLRVEKEAAAGEAAAAAAAEGEGGKKKKPKELRRVFRSAESIVDTVQELLQKVAAAGGALDALSDEETGVLKKRKLLALSTVKSLRVSPGPQFAAGGKKAAPDLTREMLIKGTWKEASFKPLNLEAEGEKPAGGALHPLLKVKSMFREIFLEMGFEEMETNKYVESSFWNFDALFQPQQHPARDAHDTFFVKAPAATLTLPQDYLERVKATHEDGGSSLPEEYNAHSRGWNYDWSEDEARKNLLRTHTTAVSSRTLYKIAQLAAKSGKEFKPQKYFSIDRVFRNEALDATHLAEFHQIEGFVIDRNLSLGTLMGTIADFFRRLGPEFDDIKFKPTYNPYTEPSMEFYSYHPGLGKWVEVGNSGIFRPEMLRPMGFDEDVSVIAWGLGLERPTMKKYGYKNIRDLFGHKIDLNMTREHPMVRWT